MARSFDLISFDFDGVILHNTFNEYYLQVARDLNLNWKAENEALLFRFFHDYWASELFKQEMAKYPREEFGRIANRRFLETLGITDAPDEVVARMVRAFEESEAFVDYYQETVLNAILEQVRDARYRVVMITNRGSSVFPLLEEWEIREHFEMVVLRDTAGEPKPSPAPFHYVNERIGIPPSRSLHIGDGPYSDVQGALNAGWTPLLLDPDDLFPELDVPRLKTLAELPRFLEEHNNGE